MARGFLSEACKPRDRYSECHAYRPGARTSHFTLPFYTKPHRPCCWHSSNLFHYNLLHLIVSHERPAEVFPCVPPCFGLCCHPPLPLLPHHSTFSRHNYVETRPNIYCFCNTNLRKLSLDLGNQWPNWEMRKLSQFWAMWDIFGIMQYIYQLQFIMKR